MRWREEEEDEFVFEKWGLKLEKASTNYRETLQLVV